MFQRGENWLKSGGNKRGRPKAGKGLTEYVRLKTRNGRELVDFYYQVYKDTKESTDTRIKAAMRLEDRGWGRPAQPITGDPAEPVSIVLHTNVDPLAKPDE